MYLWCHVAKKEKLSLEPLHMLQCCDWVPSQLGIWNSKGLWLEIRMHSTDFVGDFDGCLCCSWLLFPGHLCGLNAWECMLCFIWQKSIFQPICFATRQRRKVFLSPCPAPVPKEWFSQSLTNGLTFAITGKVTTSMACENLHAEQQWETDLWQIIGVFSKAGAVKKSQSRTCTNCQFALVTGKRFLDDLLFWSWVWTMMTWTSQWVGQMIAISSFFLHLLHDNKWDCQRWSQETVLQSRNPIASFLSFSICHRKMCQQRQRVRVNARTKCLGARFAFKDGHNASCTTSSNFSLHSQQIIISNMFACIVVQSDFLAWTSDWCIHCNTDLTWILCVLVMQNIVFPCSWTNACRDHLWACPCCFFISLHTSMTLLGG